MTKTLKSILAVAAVHLVVTLGLLLVTASIVIGNFEFGRIDFTTTDQMNRILHVLQFPLVPLASYIGIKGELPFFLNSLVWAWVIVAGMELPKRIAHSRKLSD